MEALLDTFRGLVDEVISLFQEGLVYFLSRLLGLVIVVARASYVVICLLGLFLWLSHISPYRGRGMVVGSILMAIVSEVAARMLPVG